MSPTRRRGTQPLSTVQILYSVSFCIAFFQSTSHCQEDFGVAGGKSLLELTRLEKQAPTPIFRRQV